MAVLDADHQAARPPASYSQAVKAAGLVFVSGTAPHDPALGAIKGSTVHRGGMMRRPILFVLAAQGIASVCVAAERMADRIVRLL